MVMLQRLALMVWLCLASAYGLAERQETERDSAHDVVHATSTQVMEVVAAARDYAEEDPERYYAAVHGVLDPVIDFRGFARSVMGPYASTSYYKSLDPAGRDELRDQLERFTEVIRENVVRTYGKGLLAFSGSRIEVSKPTEEEASQPRVSVKQLIFSDQQDPYVLMYQMGRGKSGEWQLRNVIIETVNLGEIYKNQFQASARKYDGDLNAVIDNWSTTDSES